MHPMDPAEYPPELTQHEKQPRPWSGHRAIARLCWAAALGAALPEGTLAGNATQDARRSWWWSACARPLVTLLARGQPR